MARPHHSSLKSSRTAQRRRLVFILKTGGVLIVLAGLLYGVSWLSYQPFWNIASVTVAGAASVDPAGVQAIASGDIGGAYGLVISRSNQLFYPRRKIMRDIVAAFPQVATVRLSVSAHMLTINITERQAAYWWCQTAPLAPTFPDTVPVPATSQCYQMDSLGYIFIPAATTTAPLFAFYGRVGTSSAPVGSSYMPADQFAALNELITQLGAHALPSTALIDRPDGVDELFLTQGGMIVFDDTEDFTQVLADVVSLQANSTIFNADSKIAYVDVRLGNKAYYKSATSAASASTSPASQ